MHTLEAIRSRRSHKRLTAPAPTHDEVRTLLDAAVCAPDHKLRRPWRFYVLEGAGKARFARICADGLLRREADATRGQVDKELAKLDRAPMVIVVAAKRVPSKLPFVELVAATAAAVQNLLLAATDLGYGSIWRTGATTQDPYVKAELGLEPDDELLGVIYLGTPVEDPEPTERTTDSVVQWWPS